MKIGTRKSKNDMELLLSRPAALAMTAGAVFYVDQAIKERIDQEPAGTFPRDGTGGLLSHVSFARYHNRGLAMGRLRDRQELVRGIGALGSGTVFAALCRSVYKKEGLAKQLGLALTLGGALSNLYDRIIRGYVVDYMIIKKKPLDRIVINLGDAAIFAGSLLYTAGSILQDMTGSKKGKH